jgi:hypothetical protein
MYIFTYVLKYPLIRTYIYRYKIHDSVDPESRDFVEVLYICIYVYIYIYIYYYVCVYTYIYNEDDDLMILSWLLYSIVI